MSNNPWPFVLVALSSLGFLANSMAEPQDGADARDAAEERLTQPVLKLDATNESSESVTPPENWDRFQPRSAVNPVSASPTSEIPETIPFTPANQTPKTLLGTLQTPATVNGMESQSKEDSVSTFGGAPSTRLGRIGGTGSTVPDGGTASSSRLDGFELPQNATPINREQDGYNPTPVSSNRTRLNANSNMNRLGGVVPRPNTEDRGSTLRGNDFTLGDDLPPEQSEVWDPKSLPPREVYDDQAFTYGGTRDGSEFFGNSEAGQPAYGQPAYGQANGQGFTNPEQRVPIQTAQVQDSSGNAYLGGIRSYSNQPTRTQGQPLSPGHEAGRHIDENAGRTHEAAMMGRNSGMLRPIKLTANVSDGFQPQPSSQDAGVQNGTEVNSANQESTPLVSEPTPSRNGFTDILNRVRNRVVGSTDNSPIDVPAATGSHATGSGATGPGATISDDPSTRSMETNSEQAATPPKLPLWPTMGLFASLAANLFFGWVAWNAHSRHREIVQELSESDLATERRSRRASDSSRSTTSGRRSREQDEAEFLSGGLEV